MKKLLWTLSTVLFIMGFGIIVAVSWKIALGIFILLWANNLENKIK